MTKSKELINTEKNTFSEKKSKIKSIAERLGSVIYDLQQERKIGATDLQNIVFTLANGEKNRDEFFRGFWKGFQTRNMEIEKRAKEELPSGVKILDINSTKVNEEKTKEIVQRLRNLLPGLDRMIIEEMFPKYFPKK